MLAVVLMMAAAAGQAESPRAIIERAVVEAGGDPWFNPQTLVLEGSADFYGPASAAPSPTASSAHRVN